jgi:hypothetical protein
MVKLNDLRMPYKQAFRQQREQLAELEHRRQAANRGIPFWSDAAAPPPKPGIVKRIGRPLVWQRMYPLPWMIYSTWRCPS